MSFDLILRMLPKRALPAIALLAAGWLIHGYWTFNQALPEKVSAQVLRIDTAYVRLSELQVIDMRHDDAIEALRTEQSSIYDYLEKILCRQEANSGLRPMAECNRIEVRRPD